MRILRKYFELSRIYLLQLSKLANSGRQIVTQNSLKMEADYDAWYNDQIVLRRASVANLQLNMEAQKEVARSLEARARFCKLKMDNAKNDEVSMAVFSARYWCVMKTLCKVSEDSEKLLVEYITGNNFLRIAEKQLRERNAREEGARADARAAAREAAAREAAREADREPVEPVVVIDRPVEAAAG